jgi:hypothetical protein
MSLQEADRRGDGGGRRVFVLLGLGFLVVVLLIVLSVAAYFVYSKLSRNLKTTRDLPLEATSTTVKASGFVKSVENLYADLTGGRKCGEDRACFDEAASACKRAYFIFDTGRVIQNRTVVGKVGDKCEVYYEIVGVKDPQVTSTEWVGLSMTCRLNTTDIPKDILTVDNPECSGGLWDNLSSYSKR